MHETLEAVIDENGQIRLLEPLNLSHPTRALVTVLEAKSADETANEPAVLSEAALAKDWERQEEDEAWQSLLLPLS